MNTTMESRRQKYIGLKGVIALIVIVYMIMPVSTDLYLPALPLLTEVFKASRALVNMTISMFYLFLSIGILLFGCLSDKYGRKNLLLAGVVIYSLSNFICVFANDINLLIYCRALQGLSAGACISITVAIVKDCFYGKTRYKVLAMMQSIGVAASVLSPLIGGLILKIGNWQMLFIVPGVFSLSFIILTALYTETLLPKNRTKENFFKSFTRLFVVCKNMKFTLLLLTFSLFTIPFMAYIALASYVYVDLFGLTKQTFSIFHSMNALVSLIGPLLYVYLLNKFSSKKLVEFSFIFILLYSLLIICLGYRAPILFFLVAAPSTILFRFTRPLIIGLLFKQQAQDAGSVSSLVNAFNRFFGSIGVFLVSIPFLSLTCRLGIVTLLSGVLGIIMWMVILKLYKTIPGIK